ncbi:Tubulin-specific chaperone cofactor E-like protein [Holothuria leucospilota]|uniref:Tubulin-specific chaperone cofactor E-like protein n=1 Tax=Holothuria leucospilota TaxID=206669 RepID=A0A9Q1BD14_HOLLE|nr:Tubulin-specific chaperone cofactor E-like protein [Holothuria leucospilota]
MSKTFTEALRGKYCAEDGNEEENFANMILISRPRRISSSADLEYLTNVVLSGLQIGAVHVTPESMRSLCPNVIDLDLSENLLNSWGHVMQLISSLPRLKFLNLAGNRFRPFNNVISWPENCPESHLENLVLNYTGATWKDAIAIGNVLPHLKELHLCQNEYSRIPASTHDITKSLSKLQCLRLYGNYFRRWEELGKLNQLPSLQTLILSNNPLQNVTTVIPLSPRKVVSPRRSKESPRSKKTEGSPHPKRTRTKSGGDTNSHVFRKLFTNELDFGDEGSDCDVINHLMEEMLSVVALGSERMYKCYLDHALSKPKTPEGCLSKEEQTAPMDTALSLSELTEEDNPGFPALRMLCVSNTRLSHWSDLEALTKFPSLKSLRLQGISLMNHISADDRRKLFIASLPNIKILNGSEVSRSEREKAERFYIRHFIRETVKPNRYAALFEKYGELRPLDEVDLGRGFQEYAALSFVYGGRSIHQCSIHLTQSVGKLKCSVHSC